MPTPDAHQFADDWLRAWNAHDIEAVLTHFHDDVVFTSPVAARVLPETGGVVRGKEALRHYWTSALAGQPGLRFELVDCSSRSTFGRDLLALSRPSVGLGISERA